MVLNFFGYFLLLFLLVINIVAFRTKQKKDKCHSLIRIYIFGSLINEILLRLFAIIFKNNTLIYNFFSLFEFIVLFYFYYLYLISYFDKKIFQFLFLVFLSIFLSEILFKGFFTLLNYSCLYTNFLLVTLSILSFRVIILATPTQLITDYSYFWINCAILIYYSCTLTIFGLRRLSYHHSGFNEITNLLLYLFIILYYSLLAVGLWKASKKQIL